MTMRRPRRSLALFALMLVAYAFRLALIAGGGQLYHPDELRYYRSIEVAKHVFNGDYTNAMKGLLRYEHHSGIASAKIIPALIHSLFHNQAHSDNLMWRDLWRTAEQNFWLPSLLFALPSVFSIGLIYLIQREAGADEVEAHLSAFLLAASNTMFIFSKHLLPYDIAIFIGLFTIYLALRIRDRRFAFSLCIGLLTFLVFWVYNGYIALAITIIFFYCLLLARRVREALSRALGIAAGVALFFFSHVAFNVLCLQNDMLEKMVWFSGTILDGEYSEGIVFPFRYLLDAEGGIGAVWLVGLFFGLRRILSQSNAADRMRGTLWLTSIVVLYLLLVLFSTGLERFVLYGRVARSLVPFIVMLSAYGLAPKLANLRRSAQTVFVIAVSLVAIANFLPAIRLQYPLDIARNVYREYDDVSFETSIHQRFDHWDLQPVIRGARYQLVDAVYHNTVPLEFEWQPEGDEIQIISHPLMYKPWQYEGATAAMRETIDREGFYIRLVDTKAGDGV